MTATDDYSDIEKAVDLEQASNDRPAIGNKVARRDLSEVEPFDVSFDENSSTGSSSLTTDSPTFTQPRRHKKHYPVITSEHMSELELGEYVPEPVTVKSLMNAGAHFGHQADKWNPKMLPFIFTERKGIHIINLDITIQRWAEARRVIVDSVSRGGTLLFVGTKQQARASVARHAKRCGSYFTTRRWLGGTLTNFSTIRKSIDRMKRLEELLNQANSGDSEVKLNKKERLTITRQLETLEGNIGGIRNMRRVPDVLFVIDVNKEHIAVAEAKRLGVAVIALVDTNVDPSTVEYAIPCNDDSTRAIDLLVASAADAVLEGLEGYESYKRENPRREESDVDATGKITEVSTRGSHGRRGHGSSGGKARNSSGGGDVKMGNSSVEPGQEPSGAGQALNDEGKSVITVSI